VKILEKKKGFNITMNLQSNDLMSVEEVEQLIFNRLSEIIAVEKIEILKGVTYLPSWIAGILIGMAGAMAGLALLAFLISIF